jgi:prepilin-type N-terminal cleavage/methylation domain-containing protein
MRRTRKYRHGFSMLELLIVVGIISILVLMYLVTFQKVLGKVKDSARAEAIRQDMLGREAAAIHEGPLRDEPATPEECRQAFRKRLDTGKEKILVSELLYVVKTPEEFRAYWNTMLNPNSIYPPVYEGTTLMALDPEGDVFPLPAIMDSHSAAHDKHGAFPIAWDFLSANPSDNTSNSIGAEVLFSDGHMEYVRYPGQFPCVKEVANLTRKFVLDMEAMGGF